MSEIIVRYPPSPTGLLHIGTVRTCLYNFLFAKKQGGRIIMRLEDTDKERSTEEYAENIMNGLKKLGIGWDEGPYRQSERSEIYRSHLEELLKTENAYYCFCTPEELDIERKRQEAEKLPPRYSGKCRSIPAEEALNRVHGGGKAVIRLKVPDNRGTIIFKDIVRDEVKTEAKEIADFVIAKNLDTALYNYTVVIDDHEMKVSHIIRGEDHIPNTPKQILIYEAFGWQIPVFAHLPLILNADRSKLSKRRNKVSVDDYLADGILLEALLNFLALIGWNTSDEKEIFSLDELIEHFSLERVQKGGAVFDADRLLWLNGVWIRQKPLSEIKELIWPFLQENNNLVQGREKYGEEFYEKAVSLVHERLKKLSEAPGLLNFFFLSDEDFAINKGLFIHQKMKVDEAIAAKSLRESLAILNELPESEWAEPQLEIHLVHLAQTLELKNGQLLWPLRVSITNEAFSPGVFEVLAALGKERSLKRIEKGIAALKN